MDSNSDKGIESQFIWLGRQPLSDPLPKASMGSSRAIAACDLTKIPRLFMMPRYGINPGKGSFDSMYTYDYADARRARRVGQHCHDFLNKVRREQRRRALG
jgi:hypothetical protein